MIDLFTFDVGDEFALQDRWYRILGFVLDPNTGRRQCLRAVEIYPYRPADEPGPSARVLTTISRAQPVDGIRRYGAASPILFSAEPKTIDPAATYSHHRVQSDRYGIAAVTVEHRGDVLCVHVAKSLLTADGYDPDAVAGAIAAALIEAANGVQTA